MKSNKTDSIENGIYTGYVWYSDQPVPRVLHNESFGIDKISDTENPFIIEAELFSSSLGKEGVSYSVRNAGGVINVIRYDLSELNSSLLPDEEVKEKKFVANKLDGVGKLIFHEYRRNTPAGIFAPEGFTMLQPKEFVFVGFEK